MKTIKYFTEKGGVTPATRKAVRIQALEHYGIDLSQAKKVEDTYHLPVAIDETTGETLYLKITASVGKMNEAKAKKEKTTSEPVDIPNLFD